jgi:MreB/Mrl family cell shape determining protein
MGLFNWFTQDIAIDLGTANTLIIHNDEIVVNEPSIVALDRNNPKNVLAVGKKALMMHEKTHESIRTVRPLKDGVIADFNAAELMIREMIKMIYPKKPLFPPSWRMMICIPSSITEVEKRAVRDSAEQAGAKEVYLLHEPMAAALGIGIDVEEPVGNMIIDIGGGTTGITVIALAGIVCDQSIRIAGDEFTADINAKIGKGKNEKMNVITLSKYNKVPEEISDKPFSKDRIAVIYAVGSIEGGDGDENTIGSDKLAATIREARLDDKVKAIAVEIDYCGVDLIRDRTGRLFVLEVNSIPAWKGLQGVVANDIAQALVDDFLGKIALQR